MSDCSKCAGCGKVANDDDQTPWKYWDDMPEESKMAIRMGIVKPVTCPKCGGSGKVSE